jgi:hypothetical protein
MGVGHRLLAFPLPLAACLPQISLAQNLHQIRLGLQTPSAAIPFIQIQTRMAPKVSRQKGKGATSGGGAAPAPLPKGSWEGSWVKERRIKVLCQGRVIPSKDLVSCRPPGGERVPRPKPGEAVVFFEHFRRGFALPANNFLWQFLDHFHLQLHHIRAM